MGMKKRLRQAERNYHSMKSGHYVFSGSAFGPGMKRAKARLDAQRAANEKRLRDAEPGIVTRQRARSHAIRGR